MKLLLTGAGGFIGSKLAIYLAQQGFDVHAISRRPLHFSAAITWHQQDLSTPIKLQNVPKFDAIIHTAARSPAPSVNDDDFQRDNVVATENLRQYALENGVAHFIFLSSVSVYGHISQPRVDAQTPIQDASPYGRSKRQGEVLLEQCQDHMHSSILRLPGVLGPQAVTPWLCNVYGRVLQNMTIPIHNADAAFNNTVHLDALSELIRQLLLDPTHGVEILPFAASEPCSIRETVQFLIDQTGSHATITVGPSNSQPFTIDPEVTIQRSGVQPLTVRETLSRYLANPGEGDWQQAIHAFHKHGC
ncbi:NAD-dependent epimerase/dehydratase family protein [Magnetococcus sp. PR-3]|uniref:NAD-dependent epimerase/dehydratase family protein n=1 Tax=Magnetococcus sp. PR-3 TaxID=3120355 RepID=UPI002FCE2840